MILLNATELFTPLFFSFLVIVPTILYFLLRSVFRGSVLFSIGIAIGSLVILTTIITNFQTKLGSVHSLWSVPMLVFLTAIVFNIIVRMLKRPLIRIVNNINILKDGGLDIEFKEKAFQRKDEIGSIASALIQLKSDLKEKADFALKIGAGTFDDSFKPSSENDELGEALIQMQNSLKQAREDEEKRKAEDKIRNWVTEGQAKFADILRQNNASIDQLSYSIVSHLVSYMNVNQAGLFILNEEDENDTFLEMAACYAYDRQKFMEKKIKIGEGLVGTCFLEGQSIYMEQVPESYLKISSGLGDERPAALLIIPLKINEEIYGVLEMASFESLPKYKSEFAERIGEIIASTISGLKINNKTAMLLEKSQQQAEEMRAQEEEMRQNMEELSATQEAMGEKDRDNQNTIEMLNQEVAELKAKLQQANK